MRILKDFEMIFIRFNYVEYFIFLAKQSHNSIIFARNNNL